MKKSNILPVVLSVSSLIATFPLAALALITQDVFDVLAYIVNASILALIGIATLLFMYGIVIYVIAKGDEKQLASGKTYMLYGIVGLTVMVAIWGFVNLLIYTIFGDESTSAISRPDITPLSGATRSRGTQICIFGICF